jgi:hypothetical protein
MTSSDELGVLVARKLWRIVHSIQIPRCVRTNSHLVHNLYTNKTDEGTVASLNGTTNSTTSQHAKHELLRLYDKLHGYCPKVKPQTAFHTELQTSSLMYLLYILYLIGSHFLSNTTSSSCHNHPNRYHHVVLFLACRETGHTCSLALGRGSSTTAACCV